MGQSPSGALDYLQFGLNPLVESKRYSGVVNTVQGVKFSDKFEGGEDLKEEDDEGHTGSPTIKISKDRTSAEGAPSFEDKLRFGEGIEDWWYMLLGHHDTPTAAVAGATTAKAWKFYQDPTTLGELCPCTILQGTNYLTKKPWAYANCVMNKLELTMNADKAPTYKATFASDYPLMNQTEPTLVFNTGDEYRLQIAQGSVYVGPAGTSYASLKNDTYKMECYTEASMELNNNIESKICGGTKFGQPNKNQKPFEATGKVKFDYNQNNMNFEEMYATGEADGVFVSQEPFKQSILFSYTGKLIETVTGTPDVPVYMKHDVYVPQASMKYTSEKGGSDAKSIDGEFEVLANGANSPIEVYMVTPLAALHYGEVPV
jgi:hypothetical protein